MVFKPDSTCERHQKYFGAFSVDSGLASELTSYFTFITRYINDGAISPDNQDDIQFFRDLLFESQHGKVHIEYYKYILDRWLLFAFTQSITVVSRYADFLAMTSELFLHDMFHHIFRMDQNRLIVEHLFDKLSPNNKVHLIKVGMSYPNLMKEIPKFKKYLLFS